MCIRDSLYMTATPRVYGDQAKAKAADADVLVASMDDRSTFGPVFHELGFGDAVAQQLGTGRQRRHGCCGWQVGAASGTPEPGALQALSLIHI